MIHADIHSIVQYMCECSEEWDRETERQQNRTQRTEESRTDQLPSQPQTGYSSTTHPITRRETHTTAPHPPTSSCSISRRSSYTHLPFINHKHTSHNILTHRYTHSQTPQPHSTDSCHIILSPLLSHIPSCLVSSTFPSLFLPLLLPRRDVSRVVSAWLLLLQ